MTEGATESTVGQSEHHTAKNLGDARTDRRWAIVTGCIALLLAQVPYLVGFLGSNQRRFLWLGYNFDDSCVYLSWMRQAADGSLIALNLFTTEPQHGMLLNPLFLLLGWLVRLTGLPPLLIYHTSRVVLGAFLLAAVWKLIRLTIADPWTRRFAFLFVCLSSGIGWIPGLWETNPIATSIDKWQPEAITFLSLYLSPLFCFSMLLQVKIYTLLLQSYRSNSATPAVKAGLCGLIQSLVHTYDIVSVAAVWFSFLAWTMIAGQIHNRNLMAAGRTDNDRQNVDWSPVVHSLLAGGIALPGALYIAYELKTEQVFRARAAVETLSPNLLWVVLGYGFTFAFAVVGFWFLLVKDKRTIVSKVPDQVEASPEEETYTERTEASSLSEESFEVKTPEQQSGEQETLHVQTFSPLQAARTVDYASVRLLIAWAVVNIAVSYFPVAFQRKMLQGAHFPIAILAATGVVAIIGSTRRNTSALRYAFKAITITAVLALTNFRFLMRECDNFQNDLVQTQTHRAYLLPGEMDALTWVSHNTPPEAVVQPIFRVSKTLPRGIDATLPCIAPAMTHRKVYCGHWGETPLYQQKLQEVITLGSPRIDETQRLEMLRTMHIDYLIFSQKAASDEEANIRFPFFRQQVPLPAFLKLVYSNPDADVYAVQK